MTAEQIIFHNYATSPFSEKIRVLFGIGQIAWSSVEVPVMLPKPDLMPLTGGYRKTPVMQIGADIYCDTALIIRELARRFPEKALLGNNPGLCYGLAMWSDRPFFMASVPVIFGRIGDMVPEAFKKDREAMAGAFSVEAMKAAAPFAEAQWRAHAALAADQLEDGRDFVAGAAPCVADAHAHMNFWFVKGAVPGIVDAAFAEWPKLASWYARVTALGHGLRSEMSAEAALHVAHAHKPAAPGPQHDSVWQPGMPAAVAADDYGRDPVKGTVLFANAAEIAILREDPKVGEVAVHFPRAGFSVTPR